MGQKQKHGQEQEFWAACPTPGTRLRSNAGTSSKSPLRDCRHLTRSHRHLTWGPRTPRKHSCSERELSRHRPPTCRDQAPQSPTDGQRSSGSEQGWPGSSGGAGAGPHHRQAGEGLGQEGHPRGHWLFLENTPTRGDGKHGGRGSREGEVHRPRTEKDLSWSTEQMMPRSHTQAQNGPVEGPPEFPRSGELQGAVSSSVY